MSMIKNYSEERSELEEAIKRLETVDGGIEKPSLPSVKLDEVKYDAPTDAELKKRAETELSDYRKNGVADIRSKSAESAAELNNKRAAYEAGLKNERAALDASYAAAAENIDNDVLKRGLARSSVAVNAKGELEADYAARSGDIAQKYGMEIAALDGEIASVGSKLNQALNDFNIAYAAKLNEKLGQLKSEREQKVRDVTEYNNSVRKAQAELDAKLKKTENELYAQELENKKNSGIDSLDDSAREEIYKSVYAQMDNFLGGLGQREAQLEIRNNTLYRQHLSDYYYYKLYDKYGR